jgi:hypothetical protein
VLAAQHLELGLGCFDVEVHRGGRHVPAIGVMSPA